MLSRWLFHLLSVVLRAPTSTNAGQHSQYSTLNAREGSAATVGRLYIDQYTALDKFEHRTDCFKQVSAESLHGKCDQLEVDESARVRVALSLAICELKAASSYDELVPMECAAFISGERVDPVDGIDPRACTQAMLRSTKAWASFSGYHRDILSICAAIQHANGLDRASELFHNATVGNIALIRYFEERTEEDNVFRESWRDLQRELRQTSEDLHMLQLRFEQAPREIVEEASELLHAAFISGDSAAVDMQARLEKTHEDSLAQYGTELRRVHNAVVGDVIARSHELATVLEKFSIRFSSLQDSLELQQQVANTVSQALDVVSTNMQATHHTADNLLTKLSDGLSISIDARKEQESALRDTMQLAESMQHLVFKVGEATKNFEETMVEVVERLPSTLAHGVVSLGHRTMESWIAELGWLSLTEITKWLVRLAWEYPVEATLVYLLVYWSISRAAALA